MQPFFQRSKLLQSLTRSPRSFWLSRYAPPWTLGFWLTLALILAWSNASSAQSPPSDSPLAPLNLSPFPAEGIDPLGDLTPSLAQPNAPWWLISTQTVVVIVLAIGCNWLLQRYWQKQVQDRLVRYLGLMFSSGDSRPQPDDLQPGEEAAPLTAEAAEALVLAQERANLRDDETRQSLDRLLSFLLLLLRVILWITAVLYITTLYPRTQEISNIAIGALWGTLTQRFFVLGDSSYSLTDLLVLAIMFWGLVIGSSTITKLIKIRLLSLTRMSRGAQEIVAAITRYVLIFLGTVTLLQVWGLDLSSLALLGGALGVGIGFGLQDIARDFSSGLVLLFERSIQVGDFIEVDNYMGTVERVGPRSVLLRTLDQISVIVPNSSFISNNVINWSHDNPISRLRLSTPVAYGSDVEVVRHCLLTAAAEHPEILSQPEPKVVFLGYGDSSLDFEIFAWVRDPARQVLIKSELFFRIEEQFRRHQVEVPFPQQDLHVRSGHLPIQLSPTLEQTLTHLLQRWDINPPAPAPAPAPPHDEMRPCSPAENPPSLGEG